MADRWMDERDREWRDRDWRRSQRFGRGERDDDYGQADYRTGSQEERSWRSGDARGYGEAGFGAGRSLSGGYGRERVFGERETGASYGPQGAYGGEDYARRQDYGAPRYGQGGRRYAGQDDSYGGRFYGDDARQPIYREEYGLGGADYGPAPSGYGAYGSQNYGGQGYGSNDPGGYRSENRDFRGGEHHTPNVRGGRGEGGRGWWDRARDQVASWFGDDDAQRRHDWDEKRAGHRGRGPKGYRRSDQRISEDVNDRLTDDPWVDATAIVVAVKDAEVTLSGSVSDRDAKHRAERIVEDVSGVEHVQNNLRVEHAGSNPITGSGRGFGDSAVQASGGDGGSLGEASRAPGKGSSAN